MMLAVGGNPDCKSMMCTRSFPNKDNLKDSVCIGYHCANCGEPSSMYGHSSWGEFTCKGVDVNPTD